MSRHHRGQRRRFPLSSSVGVDGDSAVVSSPLAVYTAAEALVALRVGYMCTLAVYLNFSPGGIQYPHCPLDGTSEAAAEAEAAAASASSDLEKKFRSHSDERGEGEGEGRRFSFVSCERFIGREFSWNSRYLEPCHRTCKVSTWFRGTIVTCFYNKYKCVRVR